MYQQEEGTAMEPEVTADLLNVKMSPYIYFVFKYDLITIYQIRFEYRIVPTGARDRGGAREVIADLLNVKMSPYNLLCL